jgi:adenylate cyclase
LKPPETWQAHDYYLRAAAIFGSFMASWKVQELYDVRRFLEHSLSIDASYSRAHAMLSLTYTIAWAQPLDGDNLVAATLDRAYDLARNGVQLDPNLPQGHAAFGWVLNYKCQHDASIAEFEKAIALNPNYTDWRFAAALLYAGQPESAVEMFRTHMRADPFYQPLTLAWLGATHYVLKQYLEALPPLRECVSRAPNMRTGHMALAATYAQLGKLEEAQAEAAEVLRIEPNFTVDRSYRRVSVYKRPQDAEHFFDGFRKAGLPEK